MDGRAHRHAEAKRDGDGTGDEEVNRHCVRVEVVELVEGRLELVGDRVYPARTREGILVNDARLDVDLRERTAHDFAGKHRIDEVGCRHADNEVAFGGAPVAGHAIGADLDTGGLSRGVWPRPCLLLMMVLEDVHDAPGAQEVPELDRERDRCGPEIGDAVVGPSDEERLHLVAIGVGNDAGGLVPIPGGESSLSRLHQIDDDALPRARAERLRKRSECLCVFNAKMAS